jgi:hypothetical protein
VTIGIDMAAPAPAGFGFIQRELDRIAGALRRAPSPECHQRLYAAQQALSWALEPNGFAAPYDVITADIQAGSEGYSGSPHQAQS